MFFDRTIDRAQQFRAITANISLHYYFETKREQLYNIHV